MQCVRPYVPPKAVHAGFSGRSPCTRDLHHPSCDAQSCICRHDLDACNQLGHLAPSMSRHGRPVDASMPCVAIHLAVGLAVGYTLLGRGVELGDGLARGVSESFRGAQVCGEVAHALKNVELVGRMLGGRRVGILGSPTDIRPGAGLCLGVAGGGLQGAGGDAQVEGREDQLDAVLFLDFN